MWSAIETGARYGISFLVGIVLARLLSPDEYGLIGILTIFINFFNVIVDNDDKIVIGIRRDGTTAGMQLKDAIEFILTNE